MDTIELKRLLDARNVTPNAYSLQGGLRSETCTLARAGDVWEVYYSERGLKTGLKLFTTESDACEYFLTWVSATARNGNGDDR